MNILNCWMRIDNSTGEQVLFVYMCTHLVSVHTYNIVLCVHMYICLLVHMDISAFCTCV